MGTIRKCAFVCLLGAVACAGSEPVDPGRNPAAAATLQIAAAGGNALALPLPRRTTRILGGHHVSAGSLPGLGLPTDPPPPPPPPPPADLGAETFNATSSSLQVRWTAPSGAAAARVFLAPEPPPAAGAAMPAEARVATLPGTAAQASVTGLAPDVDVFLRVEVDTAAGTLSQVVHGRTLGGPRAPLDDAVREVHAMAPKVLQVVLFNGSGAAWQAGPWTVTRGDGTAIPVTAVKRHSIPIGAPQYTVGYGKDYSDTVIDADHRIYLLLGAALGTAPDLLKVQGPGVLFTLPFSDRYLATPAIQLNQVGYNPRATKRWAYVSGWLGDGGALSLADLPATADVLSEPADPAAPRPVVKSGLAIAARSANDVDSGGEVRQIDLASVPPAEGVRLHVRIPGVGVSWPTQVSEIGAFKAFFQVERGLFFNRWGGDIQSVCDELARPADHPFVYTAEYDNSNFDYKFPATQPQVDRRALAGGYHDAGDFDQRPMHTVVAQVLMRAFESDPSKYPDGQCDIPESGNGIPDLLDEALWGVSSWMQLQEADGGVRMGVESTRHPWAFYTADTDPLVYFTYSRDARVSARAAGLFAQASRLVAPYDAAKAADLRDRAVRAYAWSKAHGGPFQHLLYGAGELFRLTGEAQYDADFRADWAAMGPYGVFSNLAEFQLLMADYVNPGQVMPDFVLAYVNSPGASADIRSTTLTWLTNLANKWTTAVLDNHAHRSPRPGNYNWDWGMGTVTARYMDTVIARMALGGLSAADQQKYLDALSLSADYALGGNPNGLVYFTLLGSRHVEEPLHLDSLAWIKQGRGPAPGIPAYGPIEGMPAAEYMVPAKNAFYPAFSSHPKGLRYGDVRTLVNTNEFSVWEVQAPTVEMFALLAGRGTMPPMDWMTGHGGHNDPLP